MGCCGGEEPEKQGMVENRRCRDVLFLLLFVAYWVGMFIVCGIAFQSGDPNRLIYAIDSRGMLCGSKNTYENSTIDLTDKPNLYYLNALDLLKVSNLMYAKTICVSSCPTLQELCSIGQLPCARNEQYMCPYFRFAEEGLYGKLSSVNSTAAVDYWDQLPAAQLDSCDGSFLQATQSNAGLDLSALGVNVSMCDVAAGSSIGGKFLQAQSQFPGKGPCYPVWAATVPYFNRCFPKFPENFTSSVYSMLDTTSGVMQSATGTLKNAWSGTGPQFSQHVADISKGVLIIVVGGLACGVGLSLVWMFILHYLAGFMVWATIAVVNAALVGCTLYAYNTAGMLTQAGQWGAAISAQLPPFADPTGMTRQNWSYIAYALTAVAVLVFLLTMVMLSRVKVAIACIKVASQAVSTMPCIMLFPLLPFILEVGLIIYWVAVTAVLYSAGTPTDHWRQPTQELQPLSLKELMLTNSSQPAPPATLKPDTTNMTRTEVMDLCASSPDCYISYDWDNRLMYAFIYHLFGLLWTNQFIVGFCSVVVAGAVANYYWSRGDSSNQPTFPVLKAMRNTVIFHLGSIALGAFIIAVIQFIRLVLEYVDKKTRHLQQQNKLAQWLMCIVKCLMWCLEKIVAFINRNAFILVAVKGGNYCSSAARAVQLIVANALRLAAVNVVGDALLFLGKLGVAACCGVVAFAMSNLEYYNNQDKYPSTYLSSGIMPIAVAVLAGYIVAQIFFSVYEMAIDTVLLSFCEDCESNNGHPKCAPPLLLEALGEKAPVEAEQDAHHPQKPQRHR